MTTQEFNKHKKPDMRFSIRASKAEAFKKLCDDMGMNGTEIVDYFVTEILKDRRKLGDFLPEEKIFYSPINMKRSLESLEEVRQGKAGKTYEDVSEILADCPR